jgi:hypothetical protein
VLEPGLDPAGLDDALDLPMVKPWTRWQLVGTGLFLLFMWFACWAATVGPSMGAVYTQWSLGNGLAFLAGIAFGMAVKAR